MAEEMVDLGVGKEKALGMIQIPKATLLPFLVSGGAVALLNEVVLALRRRDGDVLRCV